MPYFLYLSLAIFWSIDNAFLDKNIITHYHLLHSPTGIYCLLPFSLLWSFHLILFYFISSLFILERRQDADKYIQYNILYLQKKNQFFNKKTFFQRRRHAQMCVLRYSLELFRDWQLHMVMLRPEWASLMDDFAGEYLLQFSPKNNYLTNLKFGSPKKSH